MSSEELRFDRQKWGELLKPVMRGWQRMYKPGDFSNIQIKPAHLTNTDPVAAFVFMEMHNALSTLSTVAESMQGIQQVFFEAGSSALLTSKIENDAKCLLKQEVPDQWTTFWEGPADTLAWMRAFLAKVSHLRTWLSNATSLTKRPLRLSDLLRPATFLNALRQQTSSEFRCSID